VLADVVLYQSALYYCLPCVVSSSVVQFVFSNPWWHCDCVY